MKKLLLLILSVLILGDFQVSAQTSLQEPVEVSKEKARINGTVCYVHTVKHGQTLYSISKAYDVPISDIESANPSAKEGLKTGTLLYIPVSGTSTVSIAAKNTQAAEQTTVQKKEEPAPQPEKKAKKKKEKKKKQSSQTEYKYRYVRQETAATAVTVTAADKTVTAALDAGSEQESHTSVQEEQKPVGDETPAASEPASPSTVSSDLYEKLNQSHTVSLVMPFGKSARYGAAEINQCDFYSGALMALYDLKQDGRCQDYTLNVIDLDKWDSAEYMLNDDTNLRESALIIGPITLRDVTPVAEYAKENRIPMVIPMVSTLDVRTASLAADNPYLFIYPSSAESVQRTLVEHFFADVTDGQTLVVISEKGKMPTSVAALASSWSDSTGTPVINYSYAILQNQQVNSDLMQMIPEENPIQARILVASEDEAFVADALRNLNVLVTTEKRNLAVYGLPKWRNFGSIQLEYLHHLNTHICLSYYIDYNDSETLGMTERFESIYHTSPTPFAYQGYDITRFFIGALESFGSTFPVDIMNIRHSEIQSDIEFHNVGLGGGFTNSAVRSIVYRPDWSIECE